MIIKIKNKKINKDNKEIKNNEFVLDEKIIHMIISTIKEFIRVLLFIIYMISN